LDFRNQSTSKPQALELLHNNQHLFVTFISFPVGENNWYVVDDQPFADAFASSLLYKHDSFWLGFLIICIIAIAGFFNIQKINKITSLSLKIKESDIRKNEFSAMVTHELKTPLMPIIGYCKMLKTNMFGTLNSEQIAPIEAIERNAKHLESLITDIMDVRKLDMHKMKFNIEQINLVAFFKEIESNYKLVLDQQGINLVIKTSLSNQTIDADKTRLTQVFGNLLSNSIKFKSTENSVIEIGGYSSKNFVILYVKDNGLGIPLEKQSNLFKKFYQVDTSERRFASGTGLGLAISKGIIEKFNGEMWIESDRKSGTTVFMKLPYA
jgi:signal transduction histidine kinase